MPLRASVRLCIRADKRRFVPLPWISQSWSRLFSTSLKTSLAKVHDLKSWELEEFQESAFDPQIPAKLKYLEGNIPEACSKWFVHDGKHDFIHTQQHRPRSSDLRTSFWSEYEDTIVPLELTHEPTKETYDENQSHFQRANAPLKLLLTYLGNPLSPASASMRQSHSIYLAQCDLRDLPNSLQTDVLTPELVKYAGRGDIYASSLWMGRPPTYTPLHRDPNPNFFVQLAGQKKIRLFSPDIGGAIFDHVQQLLASKTHGSGRGIASPVASAAFRGEEMMQGAEKNVLHDIVWQNENEKNTEVLRHALEADLAMGEALFIPKGWWHSVKGVGEGVTASVNWWFR